MGIRVNYTPVSATGSMAAAAGRASAATRAQQQEFQRQMQLEQINANMQLQQERIMAEERARADQLAFNREQLSQQASQFATTQQTQEDQMALTSINQARQVQAASEARDAELALRYQAMEQEAALKQESFRLQEAATKQAERQIANQEARTYMLNLEGAERVQQQTTAREMRESVLESWKSLRGQVDDLTYQRGLAAIAAGKTPPAIPTEKGKLTVNQLMNQMRKANEELSPIDYNRYRKMAADTIGTPEFSMGYTKDKGQLMADYDRFKQATGYSGKNPRQQMQLDAAFDEAIDAMNQLSTKGLLSFGEEFEWNPQELDSVRQESYRTSAMQFSMGTTGTDTTITATPAQTKAVHKRIPENEAMRYLREANGDADLARQNAMQDGWTAAQLGG